ncbi:MAG: peptide-methionine (S)-S-oxide reductase MsrA [Candidatus Saccharimonadales bacterium]
MEIATLGAGCYWCLDAFYRRVRGVESVEAGYSGGHVDNPTTDRVYMGDTGHAEVVHVTFDPSVITYTEILEIFFVMHDPTTLNRQNYDTGEEYRSIILYHNDEQRMIAEELAVNFAAPLYKEPIVTQIVAFEKFWPADEYMQDFYAKNPSVGYCMAIIDPKIQKLRQKFADKLK